MDGQIKRSFSSKEDVVTAGAAEIESHHATVHAARRNGMDSYAMEPRPRSNSVPRVRTPVDSDDPAFTGGGSIGYNELLKQEGD